MQDTVSYWLQQVVLKAYRDVTETEAEPVSVQAQKVITLSTSLLLLLLSITWNCLVLNEKIPSDASLPLLVFI